jgi:hypothetical protein
MPNQPFLVVASQSQVKIATLGLLAPGFALRRP